MLLLHGSSLYHGLLYEYSSSGSIECRVEALGAVVLRLAAQVVLHYGKSLLVCLISAFLSMAFLQEKTKCVKISKMRMKNFVWREIYHPTFKKRKRKRKNHTKHTFEKPLCFHVMTLGERDPSFHVRSIWKCESGRMCNISLLILLFIFTVKFAIKFGMYILK